MQINLQSHRVPYVISAIVLLFWMLLRSPGVLHVDTSSQLELISRGEFSSQWTFSYFFFVKFFSFNGLTTIPILALQLIIFFFTLSKLLFSIYGNNTVTERTIISFTLTPFFGYYATFLNHDVWGLCGTLILVSLIFDIVVYKRRINYGLLALGLALSTFTYISLIAAFVFCIVLFLSRFKTLVICVTALLLVYVGLTVALPSKAHQGMKLITLISDLKCVLQDNPSYLGNSELKPLLSLQTKDFWLSQIGTKCLDANFIYGQLNHEKIVNVEVLKSYFYILQKEPEEVIKYHLVKSGYALPPPIVGLPPNRYDLSSYSSDISTIKANELLPVARSDGFTFNFMEILRNVLDLFTYTINLRTDLIGWAGAWLIVIILFLRKVTGGVNLKLIYVLSPLLASHAFVIVFAPVGDSRYLSTTIYFGLILTFYQLIRKFSMRSDNRELTKI